VAAVANGKSSKNLGKSSKNLGTSSKNVGFFKRTRKCNHLYKLYFLFLEKKTVNRDVFDGNMIYKWRLK